MEREDLLAVLRGLDAADRVITALDVPTAEAALALAGRLGDRARFVKVGLELFTAAGPTVVQLLQGKGKLIFLDLKFNDIPNTVAGAARSAARLGVDLMTMHAGCGQAAMTAAVEALATAPPGPTGRRPALLAVTVLTSLGPEDLAILGPENLASLGPETLATTAPGAGTVAAQVQRLARLAWQSGCDGLVCAAADLPALRAELGPEPLAVTPGIRPAGDAVQDQKRVATARSACRDGADFLVVGRPITGAEDPARAHAAITAELEVSA